MPFEFKAIPEMKQAYLQDIDGMQSAAYKSAYEKKPTDTALLGRIDTISANHTDDSPDGLLKKARALYEICSERELLVYLVSDVDAHDEISLLEKRLRFLTREDILSSDDVDSWVSNTRNAIRDNDTQKIEELFKDLYTKVEQSEWKNKNILQYIRDLFLWVMGLASVSPALHNIQDTQKNITTLGSTNGRGSFVEAEDWKPKVKDAMQSMITSGVAVGIHEQYPFLKTDTKPETKFSEIMQKEFKDHMYIPVRGDGNCARRSLMYGALIEASVLISEGKTEDAKKILYGIRRAMDVVQNPPDDIYDHVTGMKGMMPENWCTDIEELLENIENGKISVAELLYMCNLDYHGKLAYIDPKTKQRIAPMQNGTCKPWDLSVALSGVANAVMWNGAANIPKDKKGFGSFEGSHIDNAALLNQGDLDQLFSLSDQDKASETFSKAAFGFGLGIELRDRVYKADNSRKPDDMVVTSQGVFSNLQEAPEAGNAVEIFSYGGHVGLLISPRVQAVLDKECAQYKSCKQLPPTIGSMLEVHEQNRGR